MYDMAFAHDERTAARASEVSYKAEHRNEDCHSSAALRERFSDVLLEAEFSWGSVARWSVAGA